MAESSDLQAAAQHYLVCGNEDCNKNGQFYCNACHRPMCEQCRNVHLNSPKTRNHKIVLYRQRKHQLPVEKCELHPTRNIDIFCKECQIPLCSNCSRMKEHHRHTFEDLEEIYTEKYRMWQAEFTKIQKYFLPTSQGLKTDIEKDATAIKNIMENIRTSMKSEAESLKNLIDEVTSENIEHTYAIEKSLLKMMNSQEQIYDDYIAYLEKMTDEFQEYLSLTNKKLLLSEKLQKIQTIPETTKAVLPVFTPGHFNKDGVAKLLGRVNVPNTKPEKRKTKPTVTKVKEYSVPGVDCARNISLDKSGRLWVSDDKGYLVQIDLQGNLLQKIQTSRGYFGYHTVTQEGDMIYSDLEKRVIYRVTPDKKITKFVKTGNWYPLSIHSSHINGDILVGMKNGGEAKVTRYNNAGKEIQNIKRDNKGQGLYECPYYITENINGDSCASDFHKQAVVVVNKSGQHRFSYIGQGSGGFRPLGICTDVLGHILVCDNINNTLHLLNQDGGFLTVILLQQEEVKSLLCVCVDDENNLSVGQLTNTVTVYKYLQ